MIPNDTGVRYLDIYCRMEDVNIEMVSTRTGLVNQICMRDAHNDCDSRGLPRGGRCTVGAEKPKIARVTIVKLVIDP